MNFLAHGARHLLKIFATTSFNVWRCFLTPTALQSLEPTPCEVWAARAARERRRPSPLARQTPNNAGPPSGSSINAFHGPNRGNSRREAVLSEAPVHLQLSHPNLCRASSRIAVESGFVPMLSIGHTSSKDIVLDVPKYSAAWMRAPCTPAKSSAATRQSSAGRCQHVTETTCINQPPSSSATVWGRTRDAPGPFAAARYWTAGSSSPTLAVPSPRSRPAPSGIGTAVGRSAYIDAPASR